MKKIYAPWRSEYVTSEARSKKKTTTPEECVFCAQFKDKSDENNFILKRANHTAIIMNKYPYNAGHVMVLPYEHKYDLSAYPQEVRAEAMELVSLAITALKETIQPEGFNIGINLGKTSGAGIPAHLHIHVLPRWEGDTNFMPLLADTKPISFDIGKMYFQIKKYFDGLSKQP